MIPAKTQPAAACALWFAVAISPTAALADNGALRDPAAWPFSVDSPWNLPLGAGAEKESPDAACTRSLTDPKIGTDLNAGQWSHPVYLAATSDPLVKITRKGKTVATIHIPATAEPARPRSLDSDAHLHIVDPQRRYVHEMWHAKRRSGSITVEGYTRNDLHGPGVGGGGERAYGGSALGGLIRRAELSTGIRHALALALPRSQLALGPVWPAVQQDNGAEGSYLGAVPMGQLVALSLDRHDLDALGLSPQGRAIAQALLDYGAYVVDASADLTFYAEPSAEPDIEAARADLARIRPLLRCVKNASKNAVGGPGTRIAPAAPPLQPPIADEPTQPATSARAKRPKGKAQQ